MKKLLLVLSFVALASFAFAQSSSHVPGSAEAPPFPSFGKHTLMATYISNGNLNADLPAGDSPVDAVHTISCPGTSGTCLFQADSWVQVGEGTSTQVGICFYVDGKLVNEGCFWGAEVLGDGNYLQVSTSVNAPGLSVGNHEVQTHIFFATAGARVGYYNTNYKVFKP